MEMGIWRDSSPAKLNKWKSVLFADVSNDTEKSSAGAHETVPENEQTAEENETKAEQHEENDSQGAFISFY